MGKSTINGPFSMAMLNYQRVCLMRKTHGHHINLLDQRLCIAQRFNQVCEDITHHKTALGRSAMQHAKTLLTIGESNQQASLNWKTIHKSSTRHPFTWNIIHEISISMTLCICLDRFPSTNLQSIYQSQYIYNISLGSSGIKSLLLCGLHPSLPYYKCLQILS